MLRKKLYLGNNEVHKNYVVLVALYALNEIKLELQMLLYSAKI